MKSWTLALSSILVYLGMNSASLAALPTKLYLFGGGTKPENGMSEFLRASHSNEKRVLLIVWATQRPSETCDDFKATVTSLSTLSVECSSTYEDTLKDPDAFEKRISGASGIFFSGGNQARIMKVLDQNPRLASKIRRSFKSGIPVAGTSAGTAIQSEHMILRELVSGSEDPSAVEMREGLGLMRNGFVVDQHFLKRNRDKRLIAAMKNSHQPYGLGIDEGAAVLILNSKRMIVFYGIARLYYHDPRGTFKFVDRSPLDRVMDLSRFPPH